MVAPGKLIVVEGPDGVGKSSIINGVVAALQDQGFPCIVYPFPGCEEGTLGALVYRLHHEADALGITSIDPASLQTLHVSAHIDAITRRIRPALQTSVHVILDRYWWSSWVYGSETGVPEAVLEALIALERCVWNEMQPAVIFLLQADVPWRAGESTETYKKISALYDQLAQREKARCPVQVIHNTGSMDECIAALTTMVQEIIISPQPTVCQKRKRPRQQHRQAHSPRTIQLPMAFTRLTPAVPSPVFETYWRFAAERQQVFFRRWAGTLSPWTDDPILRTYKFTNAYRAADRVSQFLIRHVIYQGDSAPEEVFFRIILFKLFNRIDTWELLCAALGEITWADFDFDRYTTVLESVMARGTAIFSAAYMMPSGGTAYRDPIKHRNYLRLLQRMLVDEVPRRLQDLSSMREGFELLRSYPMIGDFLAYQYITDLNYSSLTDFTEMEFTVPGPGARSGIRKCFHSTGELTEAEIIRVMAEEQEEHFHRLGLEFRSLWGRPLQLIDCQNLFCEVDKYARVAHPDIAGVGDRTRIKQTFRPQQASIDYWFPPKWGITNEIHIPGSEP